MSYKTLYNGYVQLHRIDEPTTLLELQCICSRILQQGLLPYNVWDVAHVLQQRVLDEQLQAESTQETESAGSNLTDTPPTDAAHQGKLPRCLLGNTTTMLPDAF